MNYAKRLVSAAFLCGAVLAPWCAVAEDDDTFHCNMCGAVLAPWCAVAEDDDTFHCNIGPITKTYGQTQWLVYGCNDDKTLVIVAAPGNPGAPYFFTLLPTDAGHSVFGEGTGKKEAIAAASDQLKSLSEDDIANVIKETKEAKTPKP